MSLVPVPWDEAYAILSGAAIGTLQEGVNRSGPAPFRFIERVWVGGHDDAMIAIHAFVLLARQAGTSINISSYSFTDAEPHTLIRTMATRPLTDAETRELVHDAQRQVAGR